LRYSEDNMILSKRTWIAIFAVGLAYFLSLVYVSPGAAQESYGFYAPAVKTACWGKTGTKVVCHHYAAREWASLNKSGKITKDSAAGGPVRPAQKATRYSGIHTFPGGFRCAVTLQAVGVTLSCWRVGRQFPVLLSLADGFYRLSSGTVARKL
jgi:hypothetical protein